MSDIPELAFSLDLRGLRTWIEEEDGQPVLHLSDGSQHVAIESVAGDSADDAKANAREFADTSRTYAAAVEMTGPVDWWTPPEVVAPHELIAMPSPPNASGL